MPRSFRFPEALGDNPKAIWILRMVVGQALRFVVTGVAAGLTLAFAGGRFLQPFLYGVQSTDAVTIATVVLLLVLAGAIAALMPARRASVTQPVDALRE